LSGTSDLIAGLEARLVLQARDVYGNSLPSGGGLITGLLSGPSPCNLVALDMDRGQYHFRFTPRLAGQYQLVVTSSGPSATAGGGAVDTHVHSLSVGARSVWPAACRVSDPVTTVSAASAVTFSIQARDRHGSIITSGGGGVAVVMHSITDLVDSAKTWHASVLDLGNGEYKAALEPVSPGQYFVLISAPQAPPTRVFTVKVVADVPDCKRSTIAMSGFHVGVRLSSKKGISTTAAGSKASIEFGLKDVFGNDAAMSEQQLQGLLDVSTCLDCSYFDPTECQCVQPVRFTHELAFGRLPTKAGVYRLQVNLPHRSEIGRAHV
jgi:hypothetical protein